MMFVVAGLWFVNGCWELFVVRECISVDRFRNSERFDDSRLSMGLDLRLLELVLLL